ncbi:hypothetical protein EDB85DRAFT_2289192 [Lactarius pseudohatsudake]|nr:hypothetical protein EDB85DRAFT_2289192 [Lactarius pseudohatsudake]
MPAPSSDAFHRSPDSRSLNHVNLMVDSFIANARAEDLRATVRILLASMPPSTAQAFTKAARSRMASSNASPLPHAQILFLFDDADPMPTSGLYDILAHARALYGAGMGLTSVGIFTTISSKEEIDSGRAGDIESARAKVAELRAALMESADAVARWGGDFPFERAAATLEVWKM